MLPAVSGSVVLTGIDVDPLALSDVVGAAVVDVVIPCVADALPASDSPWVAEADVVGAAVVPPLIVAVAVDGPAEPLASSFSRPLSPHPPSATANAHPVIPRHRLMRSPYHANPPHRTSAQMPARPSGGRPEARIQASATPAGDAYADRPHTP